MPKKEMNPILMKLIDSKPRKADTVKAQLVEAAIEVIALQGIENASFDNIGRKLKMRRSHVAYYFRTREELLDLILNYITEMTQGLTRFLMEEQETPKDKLIAIMHAAFMWATEYPNHIATYLVFYSICGREKKYQIAFREIRENGLSRVAEALSGLTKRGEAERLKLALIIQSLTLGAIFEAMARGYLTDQRYMNSLEKSVVESVFELIEAH